MDNLHQLLCYIWTWKFYRSACGYVQPSLIKCTLQNETAGKKNYKVSKQITSFFSVPIKGCKMWKHIFLPPKWPKWLINKLSLFRYTSGRSALQHHMEIHSLGEDLLTSAGSHCSFVQLASLGSSAELRLFRAQLHTGGLACWLNG